MYQLTHSPEPSQVMYSLVCRAAMWRALVVVSIQCGSGPESTYLNFNFMAVGPFPQMM